MSASVMIFGVGEAFPMEGWKVAHMLEVSEVRYGD